VGDPILQGDGAIFRENVAAHCKVMGHSAVSCADKRLNRSRCRFGWRLGPRNHDCIRWSADAPRGGGNFRGLSHWQSLMQQYNSTLMSRCDLNCVESAVKPQPTNFRCRVRCKRDHSVYRALQANANSILIISVRRRCGLLAAKGRWECTARAKYDIYDCLVLFAVDQHRISLVCMCETSDGQWLTFST